jgi:hypothetical protein
MYAQNAISVNEFLGDSWNKVKAIFRKVYLSQVWLNDKSYRYFFVTDTPRFHRTTRKASSGISWSIS